MNRRTFILALIASAVAAGVPGIAPLLPTLHIIKWRGFRYTIVYLKNLEGMEDGLWTLQDKDYSLSEKTTILVANVRIIPRFNPPLEIAT